jgi:membrane protease YdiL (CAAX protease family)
MQSNERTSSDGFFAYFLIACGLTWILAAPLVASWMHREAPPTHAVAGAGLSAFGPLVAALVIAGRQKRLGDVFGLWRTNPVWIAIALFTPMAAHLLATALSFLIGGKPTQWFHPPQTSEQIAALVVFSLGEEFGWRGFAHPRVMARYGLVKGSLVLGAAWASWHFM